jgi:hypothetical protein
MLNELITICLLIETSLLRPENFGKKKKTRFWNILYTFINRMVYRRSLKKNLEIEFVKKLNVFWHKKVEKPLSLLINIYKLLQIEHINFLGVFFLDLNFQALRVMFLLIKRPCY